MTTSKQRTIDWKKSFVFVSSMGKKRLASGYKEAATSRLVERAEMQNGPSPHLCVTVKNQEGYLGGRGRPPHPRLRCEGGMPPTGLPGPE